jgi:hypothetical protein
MLRPIRKQKVFEFSAKNNLFSALLLVALFLIGLPISFYDGLRGFAAYLALWAVSYFIIFAGACRYCVYYGKKCPIPMEGSCVHRFFEKKDSGFGWIQLIWATVVYLLRILVPAVIIIHDELLIWGLLYVTVLSLFWIVHLRFTGCPNCININCPLNPDYNHGNIPGQ